MRIIFVRHGESEGNVAHVINDNPSRVVNLTEKGRKQAHAAGDELQAVRFACAYVSEFPRARQTAEILLRHQGCRLHVDPRLNERRSGMDGMPVQMFHDLVRADRLHAKPARGESFLEQMERLRSFLNEASARHVGETVLAVSHEDPILAALALTAEDPAQTAHGSVLNCQWVEMCWPAARQPYVGKAAPA